MGHARLINVTPLCPVLSFSKVSPGSDTHTITHNKLLSATLHKNQGQRFLWAPLLSDSSDFWSFDSFLLRRFCLVQHYWVPLHRKRLKLLFFWDEIIQGCIQDELNIISTLLCSWPVEPPIHERHRIHVTLVKRETTGMIELDKWLSIMNKNSLSHNLLWKYSLMENFD